MLSFKGLPCPNLGTGGYNCHGPFECATVEKMDQMVEFFCTSWTCTRRNGIQNGRTAVPSLEGTAVRLFAIQKQKSTGTKVSVLLVRMKGFEPTLF